MKRMFYGWWVVAAAFCTFGLAVGLPYYTISFFYDYFGDTYGWRDVDITRGFLYASLLTLWVGPLVIPRVSPRKLILIGTALTGIALVCFGMMGGNIWVYWGIWVIYATGYFLSGPIPHQIIISNWFRKNRGKAMGVLYVGVGVAGALGARIVKPLTENLDFHRALMIMGALMLLAWPLAIFVLRDKPAEKGLFPDGADTAPEEIKAKPHSFRYLTRRYSFWLIVFGSMCSIGSIGAVNFLMKLVFKENMDPSITDPQQAQVLLNSTWQFAQMLILLSSIGGRLAIGAFADKFPKKWVMTVSYFLSAATIPLLLAVQPPANPWFFSILFGFAMGADYMLIPLMAAEQFGVSSLPRAMAIILPANTIAQTGFPALTAFFQELFGSYTTPMYIVFAVGIMSGISIALLPKKEKEPVEEELHVQDTRGASA
ncbi:MAG: MFS transporter [Rhodospirillales bacterium]